MDPRERMDDPEELLRIVIDATRGQIHTGFPGIVQSFNATAITAVVQPAVMGQVRDETGNWTDQKLPLLLDCPVFFPSGGGFTLTFPLAAGDEVWISLAERSIDGWWQLGGVRPQTAVQFHDLSDGFCFPKVWSQVKKISNISTTSTQLRSDDGLSYIEMAAGHVINIVAPGGLNITTPTTTNTGDMVVTKTIAVQNTGGVTSPSTINGALTATGNITAGTGTGDQVSLQTHKHPTAATGSPSSPTPGT